MPMRATMTFTSQPTQPSVAGKRFLVLEKDETWFRPAEDTLPLRPSKRLLVQRAVSDMLLCCSSMLIARCCPWLVVTHVLARAAR
jgi:hypothetical protein